MACSVVCRVLTSARHSPGYATQGNEFSYQMLFASNFILNWYNGSVLCLFT